MATEQDKARQILRDAIGEEKIPRRDLTPILYPHGGISEVFGFSDQEAGTSRDERNMRSFDAQTGRLRGAQRAGMGKYGGGNAIAADKKIDLVATVSREVNPYLWAPAVSERFDVAADKGSPVCTDIVRDIFGMFYILGQYGDVQRVNMDGVTVDSINSAHFEAEDGTELWTRTIAVDDFQNIFIATGHRAGASFELQNMIHCYEHRVDGSYARAWTIYPNIFVLDMKVYGADLFVWGVRDQGTAIAHYVFIRYTEYAVDAAPSADSFSAFNSSTDANGDNIPVLADHGDLLTTDHHVGRMAVKEDGTVFTTMSRYSALRRLVHAGVWKLQPISPNADASVWSAFYNDAQNYTTADDDVDRQGYGIGIAIGPKVVDIGEDEHGHEQIWMWGGGNLSTGVTDHQQPRIRLLRDDPTATTGPAWATSKNLSLASDTTGSVYTPTLGWLTAGTLDNLHSRGETDENDRVYIPYGVTDSDSIVDGDIFLVVRENGANLELVLSPSIADVGSVAPAVTTAVAVPFVHPDYNDVTINHTDFVMMGGPIDTGGDFAKGVNLVTFTVPTPGIREIRTIALTNQLMWRLNGDSAATAINMVADEGGLAAAYSDSTEYVQAATGNGHIYITDGLSYFDYNPKDDKISTLVSRQDGEIPKRARLISWWRNRLVLARSDLLPGTWHMSRAGDVHDWNQFPQEDDTAKAVSGATARAGSCPDSINAIVPYSDDLIWFGCDSSIWQLTGDPTGAGGEWDMITDEVGMSFGQPFCRDDAGTLWFFSSKGGLYKVDGSGMNDMSKGRIRRRLRDLDLGTYHVRLVYNYADDGIHIFICPFDVAVNPIDHYFYDKRTGSFHVDRFGAGTDKLQPTSAIVVDGDLGSDRAIILGCGDGRIRRWGSGPSGVIPKSDNFTNSDDRAIDSYVLIGPIAPVDDMSEAALSELSMVLAPDFSGVHMEMFVTDTPDSLGDPVWRSEAHAGRNAKQLVRVSGDSIYLRLRNATLDEHWAMEKATAMLSYGGQIRTRT